LHARWQTDGTNASVGSALNRVTWHLSHTRPGVAPDDYTPAMALDDRDWIRKATGPGYRDLCVMAMRALFDELLAMKLRLAGLGNPFEALHFTPILPPPNLPALLAEQRGEIVAYYREQAMLRVTTQGVDGYSEGYADHVVSYFDAFLCYLVEHNANPARTSPPCPLELADIFQRRDLAVTFLRAGKRFDSRRGTLTGGSRKQRKNAILAVHRYAQFREWIDCPDYPARLNAFLKGPKGKARLGGGEAQVIEALERDEISRVRLKFTARVAAAQRALDCARTAGGRSRAKRRMSRATRQAALFEIALCGIRVQGIASLDGRQFRRNERGSIIVDHVRAKSHDKLYWRWYWVSPRAHRAITAYYEATDRVPPLSDGATKKDMQPQLLIPAGGSYAKTRVAEDTVFVPVFINEDGGAISVTNVQSLLERLLHTSGCTVTRPHVMRHCAADIAINEWGMTPSHVAEVFGWESVAMVLDRYSKAGVDTVLEMFDAQSDAGVLSSTQAFAIASGAVDALAQFLTQQRGNVSERTVPMIWQAIVASLDELAAGDPNTVKPSAAVVLSAGEYGTVNEWVRAHSNRHLDVEKLLHRPVMLGLPAPRVLATGPLPEPTPLPKPHPDEDDEAA